MRCASSSAASSASEAARRGTGSSDMAPAAVVKVKAVATIKVTVEGLLNSLRPSKAIDNIRDLIGRSLFLELVSSELEASKLINCFFSVY